MWISDFPLYLQELFGVATSIVLLPVLSFSLLIAYFNKRQWLEECGFDRPVVGLIVIGSFFGMIADIPMIVFDEALLNMNLGGAIIPLIISGVLIYRKKLNMIAVIVGTAIVSYSAYAVSWIEPGMGIIAEFPFYFIPSVLAFTIALFLGFVGKKRGLEYSVAYSYSFGVLGTLIGADFLRIPELIEMGMLGSFGGAGAQDLVYLSGLIAAIPLIFIGYVKKDYSLPEDMLLRAKSLLKRGEYKKSREILKKEVDIQVERARKLIKRNTNNFFDVRLENSASVLLHLGFGQNMISDYYTLTQSGSNPGTSEIQRDFFTGELLSNSIANRINQVYMSLSRRILAYLIDLFILFIPFIIFFGYLFWSVMEGMDPLQISQPMMLAVISLATSIQFIYFTLTEWYFGTTIGKSILGLRVTNDDFEEITFMQSVARNAGRYADMALAYYLLSLLLMLRTPDQRRIGDYMAKTKVVRIRL